MSVESFIHSMLIFTPPTSTHHTRMHTHIHTHTHTHRRVQENAEPAKGAISDARTEVLESIAREASRKEAKELAEATRQDYIMADTKARAQEETVRKVHQKQADKAMDVSEGE